MRRAALVALVATLTIAATGCASDEIRPPFVDEESMPAGAIDGRIVVTTRGDVDYSLATFDIDSEELDGLGDTSGVRSPAFSPDGSQIAAAFNEDGRGGIALVTEDGPPTAVIDDEGYFDHPSWSPEGDRIVYAHHPPDGSWDIYILDLSTRESTPLVSDRGQDWYPSWSPDGERIAFTSDRDGDNAIWVVDVSGGSPTKLVDSEGEDAEPAWSPDGDTIVFTSNRELENWQLHVVPASGGEDRRLVRTDTIDRYPVYSPDGEFILASTGYLAAYAADGGELPGGADRWKLADELTFSATWTDT